MFSSAFQIVREFVEKRYASAGAALIGWKADTYGPYAFGQLSFCPESPPTQPDSLFDLASLTKVICTTTIALRLLEEGVLKLEDNLGRLVSDCPEDKKTITVLQLLTHASGLPAVARLDKYPRFKQRSQVLMAILALPLKAPPGRKVEYSCVGFITLGLILEQLTGANLDWLFKALIAEPLRLQDACYNPSPEQVARSAWTEWDPLTRQFLRGVVHDENARALGGVSGNAGLFAGAAELGVFSRMLLGQGSFQDSRILKPETVRLLRNNYTDDPAQPRTLGWLLPSPAHCSAGTLLSAQAIGHTGFTGTSLWIDFSREFYGVLLTNRVHPSRQNDAHLELRPRFYEAACRAMERLTD